MEAFRDGSSSDDLYIRCRKIENGSDSIVFGHTYEDVTNDGSVDVVLKLVINGSNVGYYYNDTLIASTAVSGSFSGSKMGVWIGAFNHSKSWQLAESYMGCDAVTVDYYEAGYVASSTKSVFGGGGLVYIQETEEAEPVEIDNPWDGDTDFPISPLHPTRAVEMFGKLYIADWSTPRFSGSDGAISGASHNELDATSVPDWTAGDAARDTKIIPGSDMVMITGDDDVAGVYLVTNAVADKITISPAASKDASGLNFSVIRSPKVLDLASNTISVWNTETPATDGWIPLGCPLIARFAGRIYLAGEATNPHVWYASKEGDPTSWYYAGSDDTDAYAGTTSSEGVIASAITSLLPINEDILIATTADEVWRFPPNLRVAGAIVNLSQEVGCISDDACAVTPAGQFLFLSRQGLYVVDPTAGAFQTYAAQPFSRRQIPDDLITVNQENFWISMAYDGEYDVIHLYMTPKGAGPGIHWSVELETGAIIQEILPGDYQPCVVGQSCGGTFILGGMDGYLRKYDRDATDDDGVEVTSEVVIGPFKIGSSSQTGVITAINALLAEDSEDVDWELRVGNSPEEAYNEDAFDSGTYEAGPNYSDRPNAMGVAACIVLTSTGKWALEGLDVEVEGAGHLRLL